jgi:hypothetical protein
MKKGLSLVLAAAIAAASFTACAADSDKEPDTQPETAMTEGRFLWGKSGTPMIVIDSTGPCTISTDDDSMFEEFTDGDLISLEFDGMIAESYPGQIHNVYDADLLEEGDITDIDKNTLDSLIEMGHRDPEEDSPKIITDEGIFFRTAEGKPAMVMDSEVPIEIITEDEALIAVFDSFEEGDLIKVEYTGMMTRSYPAQITGILNAEFVEKGDISSIDEFAYKSIIKFGWIEE